MNKITTNKDKLEFECDLVYYEDGLKIANQLKNVILFGKHKNCVGLAHNQIGGNKSVFVAKIDNKWRYFINPTIVSTGSESHTLSESCMSFPNKYSKVKRYLEIELHHQVKARNDIKGNAFITERFKGFNAIVIQHEVAHLGGKTIFCNK